MEAVVGRVLKVCGAAATVSFPVGAGSLALVPFGLVSPSTSLSLTAPFLLSGLVIRACGLAQRRGMRQWDLIPQPKKAMVWAVGRYSVVPTVAFNLLRHHAMPATNAYFSAIATPRRAQHSGLGALVVGGLPWAGLATRLHTQHNVGAVVNCCEESTGPTSTYRANHTAVLHIPCVDYCDVPKASIARAVAFMHDHISKGRGVYVHCKAGKGRSVTVAVAYLAVHEFGGDVEAANAALKLSRPQAINVSARPELRAFVKEWADSRQKH